MDGGREMVRLERFEKWYGKVHAVKPLDLTIAAGESFGLLGPNGGGKSTVIRALVGLHYPSNGKVFIDGEDIARFPTRARRHISYMPQRVTMPDLLTAREVVSVFARLRGATEERVDEVLEMFGLKEDADRYVREYSGGMQQRLGLAVAFLKEVPLFVLDEPTLNLDPLGIEHLRALVQKLRNSGATVVFSSHNIQDAIQLADRVAVLVEGELVKVEDVPQFRSVVTRETVVRVVLAEITDGIVSAAKEAGATISGRDGNELSFQASPDRRLEVIRAIERSGGTIEEFHTEAPDWEALVRRHLNGGGNRS